jgi:Putative DNA-binding domain
MSQRFDPFDKAIDKLEPGDLAKLRTVSEGWYVEYKKEAPTAATLAKSVAAFANTHGGWLFIGIEELSRQNPVAGWFPGIEKGNATAVVQSLRDGIATNVAPTPHFDVRVDDVRLVGSMLDGYENADRFEKLLSRKGFKTVGIADLNAVFNIILGLVNIYEKLNAKVNFTGPWFSKARILNAWRLVPFLDVDRVLDEFEKHGIPVLLEENATSPPGSHPSSFNDVPAYDELALANEDASSYSKARVLLRALNVFSPIAHAFGVPGIEAIAKQSEEKPYYILLHEAGIRSVGAQNRKKS